MHHAYKTVEVNYVAGTVLVNKYKDPNECLISTKQT